MTMPNLGSLLSVRDMLAYLFLSPSVEREAFLQYIPALSRDQRNIAEVLDAHPTFALVSDRVRCLFFGCRRHKLFH